MTRTIADISVALDSFVTGPDPGPDNGLDTGDTDRDAPDLRRRAGIR
jgi:hypothetical protein